MAMGVEKPQVWPEDKATREWLIQQRKKRRQQKAAKERKDSSLLDAARGCDATPWQEGYMEGRATNGTIEAMPYGPTADETIEWLRGFDAGRDDLRQNV